MKGNRFKSYFIRVVVYRPFFIISLFFFPLALKADFQVTPQLEEAYHDYLSLKIYSASEKVSQSLKKSPDNGFAIYLQNFDDILRLFIAEDVALYHELKKNESKRLRLLENQPEDSPWHKFTRAELKIYWAFVKLKFNDQISAAWNLRQAYKLLEENAEEHPDFLPNQKSFGLMKIIIGSIPQKFQWLVSTLGLHGNINEGLNLLDNVIKSDEMYSFEANLYKAAISNYIFTVESEGGHTIDKLYQKNPDNLLIAFLYSSILINQSKNDQALTVLQNRPQGKEYIAITYISMMVGDIYLNRGKYEIARKYYLHFLQTHRGQNFLKNVYYKLFLTHWMQDDERSAEKYLSKARKEGQTVYDSDKYAQRFAEKDSYPDKTLMQARLFTDGGYYEKALQVLKTSSLQELNNLQDSIEYYYRHGRIYHKLYRYEDAVKMYVRTIELSPENTYYFAPNAALQLGYIYNMKGNQELAVQYLNKALSYEDYQYKNSIDNKAKAELGILNLSGEKEE